MANAATACSNLGPKQTRLRLYWGIGLTAVAAAFAAYGWWAGFPWHLRAVTFFPAYFAALGFLEARCQTCVLLAELGKRNMDQGTERVADAALARKVRAVARRTYWESFLIALAATGAYLAVSELNPRG